MSQSAYDDFTYFRTRAVPVIRHFLFHSKKHSAEHTARSIEYVLQARSSALVFQKLSKTCVQASIVPVPVSDEQKSQGLKNDGRIPVVGDSFTAAAVGRCRVVAVQLF